MPYFPLKTITFSKLLVSIYIPRSDIRVQTEKIAHALHGSGPGCDICHPTNK